MNIIKKIRFKNFCIFIPLRVGAFVVAAWMFIWNLYLGIFLLTDKSLTEFYKSLFGGVYIFIALAAFYGAYSIFYEILSRVKGFTIFFLFSLAAHVTLSIIDIIMVLVSFNYKRYDCESANPVHKDLCSYSFVRWGIRLAIGVVVGGYFYIVLRSYKRELEEEQFNAPS